MHGSCGIVVKKQRKPRLYCPYGVLIPLRKPCKQARNDWEATSNNEWHNSTIFLSPNAQTWNTLTADTSPSQRNSPPKNAQNCGHNSAILNNEWAAYWSGRLLVETPTLERSGSLTNPEILISANYSGKRWLNRPGIRDKTKPRIIFLSRCREPYSDHTSSPFTTQQYHVHPRLLPCHCMKHSARILLLRCSSMPHSKTLTECWNYHNHVDDLMLKFSELIPGPRTNSM